MNDEKKALCERLRDFVDLIDKWQGKFEDEVFAECDALSEKIKNDISSERKDEIARKRAVAEISFIRLRRDLYDLSIDLEETADEWDPEGERFDE